MSETMESKSERITDFREAKRVDTRQLLRSNNPVDPDRKSVPFRIAGKHIEAEEAATAMSYRQTKLVTNMCIK